MMDIVDRLRDRKETIIGWVVNFDTCEAADEIERLRRRVEVLEMDYSHSIKESIDLGNGWKEACDEIERLRKRVELLEGYLSGALDVVEGFVHCNTKEARKALEGEE